MRLVGRIGIDALLLTVVVVSDAFADRVVVILVFWTGGRYERRVYAYEEAVAVLRIADAYVCIFAKACDFVEAGVNRIPTGISLCAYEQTQIIHTIRKPPSVLGCALLSLPLLSSALLSFLLLSSALPSPLLCTLVLYEKCTILGKQIYYVCFILYYTELIRLLAHSATTA